jgi:hypothetical protein
MVFIIAIDAADVFAPRKTLAITILPIISPLFSPPPPTLRRCHADIFFIAAFRCHYCQRHYCAIAAFSLPPDAAAFFAGYAGYAAAITMRRLIIYASAIAADFSRISPFITPSAAYFRRFRHFRRLMPLPDYCHYFLFAIFAFADYLPIRFTLSLFLMPPAIIAADYAIAAIIDYDFDTPRFSPDDITSHIVSHYYYFHAY